MCDADTHMVDMCAVDTHARVVWMWVSYVYIPIYGSYLFRLMPLLTCHAACAFVQDQAQYILSKQPSTSSPPLDRAAPLRVLSDAEVIQRLWGETGSLRSSLLVSVLMTMTSFTC